MKINNKKIIILLLFFISLFSLTAIASYSRYTSNSNMTATIKTTELVVDFQTNGNNNYAKTNSTVVDITDTHSDNIIVLKYLWSTTNDADASNGTSFSNHDEISGNDLNGTYYLCIYVQDDKGFYNNVCSNAFAFDNTAPTVSFTYNENDVYKHSQSSTVTVTNDDNMSDLDLNSFKYVWTKNINVEPNESFVSGDELTRNTGAGEYYLRIKACDMVGNCALVLSDPFKIDNEGPSATLTSSSADDMRGYISFTAEDNESSIVGYNITTTDSEPTTWIPVYDEVESATEVKQEYGATWARIFHHNNRWGSVNFSGAAEAKSANATDKYSVLENINKYKQDGKFEFLLEYPDFSDTQYNRWIQTDDPTTTSIASGDGSAYAGGYQAVHIDWTGNYWGGLVLSNANTATFIDGSVGHGNWFYAIGAYTSWNGGMPGPNSTAVSVGNLWARIDGFTPTAKATLSGRIGDIKADGTYYVWFKDGLGNVSRYEQNVTRKYLLSMDPNGGSFESSTGRTIKTYKYTDTVNLANATRTGYTFTGWSTLSSAKGIFADSTEYTSDNTSGTSYKEVKQYTVSPTFASGDVYQLDFDAKGSGRLTTYFWGASGYLQVASVTNSDGFSGTGSDGNNYVNLTSSYKHYSVKFTLGSNGNGSVNKYVLFRLLAGNSASVKNIKFNKVNASAYTYDTNVTIKKNALLYAIWNPITYSISYNLNGGSVSTANPTSYNIESNAFTLNNPTRSGYTFTGWTGTGLSSASTSVTVAKGSTGNRSYTANWSANSYYLDLNGLLNGTSSGNISGYGTADVYINGVQKANDVTDYYAQWPTGTTYEIKDIKTAAGRTYNGVSAGSLTGTIVASNVSVQLKYTTNTYTISYNLNSGSVSGNPTSYTVDTAAFTLKNPTRTGYTFTGWTGTGLSSASTSVTVAKGSTGNRSYTANWRQNCTFTVNSKQEFNYTGGVQSFTVPSGCGGTYKFEVWGAQGGGGNSLFSAGKGGYAYGSVSLTAGTTVYVVVGGQGATPTTNNTGGGYNGGGNIGNYAGGISVGGGGGATHIGKTNALLRNTAKANVYIVAGGGGGARGDASSSSCYGGGSGGAGGGTTGGNGGNQNCGGEHYTTGGSQSAAGRAYGADLASTGAGGFGYGGNGGYNNPGGGGGLYGGGGGNSSYGSGAGGGSGYIGGVSGGSMSNGQRTGNGFARITRTA